MFLFSISSNRGDKIWAARRLLKNVYFVVNIICTDYIDFGVVVVVAAVAKTEKKIRSRQQPNLYARAKDAEQSLLPLLPTQ